MSYEAPFRNLKVIDLSQGLAAPYCAMLMAQHGADVIKVEPVSGDWSRTLSTSYGNHSAFSICANLGKRSIAVDLKHPEGKALLWRLLEDADVLVEGFRPSVMSRLGFGYEAVAEKVPGIVYLSLSGFGAAGPLADRPAMDPVLQAFTGLTLENRGADGIPQRVPISIIDMTTALYAFQALSAALYAKRDEVRGRHLSVSLLEGAAALQTVRLIAAALDGDEATTNVPPSGSFEVADGWMQIQIIKESEWHSLCQALESMDIALDPRFSSRAARIANQPALLTALRDRFRRFSSIELSRRFEAAGLLYERLNSYSGFLRHEHVVATDAIGWLDQQGAPVPVPIPRLPGSVALIRTDPRARFASLRSAHVRGAAGAWTGRGTHQGARPERRYWPGTGHGPAQARPSGRCSGRCEGRRHEDRPDVARKSGRRRYRRVRLLQAWQVT